MLPALLLFPVLLTAAPAPEKEFQRLTDMALAAPPELAADILLRLVESNAVKGQERKLELLQQAFQLARSARFPLKIAHYGPSHSTDSDIGVLEASLRANLDALSLRCRVVRQMLRIDRRAALEEFFNQIPLPQVPALGCKDAVGYSFDDYYALVAELANTAFTAKEIRESKPALFVETQVRSIASPFQVEGAAKAIVASKVTDDEFGRLVAAFSSSLKAMNGDARSFSSATYRVNRSVSLLAEECQRRSVSGYGLVDAYRSYVVRHLSASRCGEDEQFADTRAFFNETLRRSAFPAAEGIPPIDPDELKPSKTEERAAIYEYWRQGQPHSDLLTGVKRLRFGLTKEQQDAVAARGLRPDRMASFLTIEERKDPQWEIAFRDFLNTLENRKKDFSESESNHFHMVCFTYIPLIDLAPPGDLQQTALKSLIEFLKRSPIERSSPPEWLMEFSRLLSHRDGTPEGKAGLREEIKRSGDLVMNLYLELERITAKPR